MSLHHANCAETTLAAAITTTGETSITVTSEAGFPAVDFIISIGSEVMLVTNVATTTWTVTRGYEGSTAATHLNGAAIYHDISAAEADAIAGKLDKAGGTMTGNLIMDNMDITLVKLLTLHGEIDDGNSGAADTIDWNSGAAHKSTLTGNVTFAFTDDGYLIPLMTSNTAPSGVCTSNTDSLNAYKRHDRDNATYSAYPRSANGWGRYDFGAGNSATADSYYISFIGAGNEATAWKIQGSQNGTDWTDLDVVTGASIGNTRTKYTIDTPAAYRYYQILETAVTGSAYVTCFDIMTTAAIVDPAAPCFLTLKLVQDGTGGRTVTWPATVKGTPIVDLTASATSNVLFYWDGTSYWTLNGLRPSETWGYQTTATATGTTTLTLDSRKLQFFTGTAAQTVKLPVTSTLALGQQYIITNNSTLAVTVQSSGANSILVLAAGETGVFTCITLAGTGATNWSAYTVARKDVAQVFAAAVTSTQFKLSALNTAPSAANDTGVLGEIRIVDGYIYVCTATNTWKRAAIATW